MWIDKDGRPFYGRSITYNGRRIFNPTNAMMIEAGYSWKEPEPPTPVPEVKRYSKLKIIRKLDSLWPEYKAKLEKAGLFDQFMAAKYLAEDDPVFVAFISTVPKELLEQLEDCLWED